MKKSNLIIDPTTWQTTGYCHHLGKKEINRREPTLKLKPACHRKPWEQLGHVDDKAKRGFVCIWVVIMC